MTLSEARGGLVLVNLSPELVSAFRNREVIAADVILVDDLDHALEACEKRSLPPIRRRMRKDEACANGSRKRCSADLAEQLTAYCQRLEVRQNDVIASQGDPADCMHFIV
jgi:sulfate permease, SulP family